MASNGTYPAKIYHHAAGDPSLRDVARPGDFLVITGDSWVSHIIRIFCDRSHAAAVADTSGGLIESLWSGPVRTDIADYDGQDYVLISPDLTVGEREKAVDYLESCVGFRYSYLSLLVGVPLAYLSWYRLILTSRESVICSALCAHAMRSTGQWFRKPASIMTPDDLEKAYRKDA